MTPRRIATTAAQSTAAFSGRGKAGAALLALAVAGAALAGGTVHTVVLCTVGVVLAAATGLTWWDAEPIRPRTSATILLITGCALTAYTVAQCIPLPLGLLERIAPHNAEVWSRALSPLREPGPRWAPISLDPTATRVEALKGVAYLLAFLSAVKIARRRSGAAFLSEVVIVTGLALAIAALLHPAFGVQKLYGIWQPTKPDAKHIAPLLNPNNLAGYINVALCLTLASALSREPRIPRPILAAMALVLAATQIWVASRAGVVMMVLGTALVVTLSRVGQGAWSRVATIASAGAGILMFAALFAAVLSASQESGAELLSTATNKPEVVREALRMIPAYPWWGIGRGAFESAFPAFRSTGGYWTTTHPENFVAQWLIEWGVPIGAAGLGAIAFALRPGAALVRSSVACGAWAAIAALAVQNMVDLGSELPGLVLAPVLCAGIVVGTTAGRPSRWLAENWTLAPRSLAIVAPAAGLGAVILAALGIGRELHDDQKRLHALAVERKDDTPELEPPARAAMLRHPAEPYLPFIVGYRFALGGDASPVPWIAAALERSKLHGPAHMILARWLTPRSPSQARLEYRLALEQAPDLAESILHEAPRLVAGYDDALELAPPGGYGDFILSQLANTIQSRLPSTSLRLEEDLARHDRSTYSRLALRIAEATVADLSTTDPAPWCAEPGHAECERVALARSEEAESLTPADCEARVVRARALLLTNARTAGRAELSHASEAAPDRNSCLRTIAQVAEEFREDRVESDALGEIANAACASDGECATNLAWVASLEQRRGNTRRALALYKRAHERAPEAGYLPSVAGLTAGMGLHVEAAQEYEELARHDPANGAWRKAAEDERAAAFRAAAHL